jgi:hypothetical protein
MKIKNRFKEILTKYNKERKKRIIIVLTLSSLFVFYTLITKETNHYSNPKAHLEWISLIEKYPDDMPLQALHALRLGLRMKVERGDINLDEATEVFEKIKKSFIKKKEQLENNSKKQEKGSIVKA